MDIELQTKLNAAQVALREAEQALDRALDAHQSAAYTMVNLQVTARRAAPDAYATPLQYLKDVMRSNRAQWSGGHTSRRNISEEHMRLAAIEVFTNLS